MDLKQRYLAARPASSNSTSENINLVYPEPASHQTQAILVYNRPTGSVVFNLEMLAKF